ncbi:MAG: WD domain, G-beta repeat [Methanoregulaceae archaeon PtaB.Bin009]|nr:MAG: WD domain, G-beta repeat [Methanoregulaceae archaeon PtaB.Bin009]
MPAMDRMITRVSCGTPLIGRLIRSSAITGLAVAARCGDNGAVRALSRAFVDSVHPDVRDAARECLSSLESPDALEAFCDCVLGEGDPRLISIARKCGYLPRSDERKALFLFLTGEIAAWRELDLLEGHPLLEKSLLSAPPDIRSRALAQAREQGIARLFHALADRPDAPGWSTGDWSAHFDFCRKERRWDELYALLFLAPLPYAVDAVQTLRVSGYKPPDTDLALWKDLLALVPDRWRYPEPPEAPSGMLSGPGGRVEQAAFSPDGTHLATLGCDGTLCQWSLPGGVLLSSCRPACGGITTLAYAPGGLALVLGGNDGRVRVLGTGNSTEIREWQAHGSAVAAIAFPPEGDTLLSAGFDGTVCTWTWPGGEVADRRHLHDCAVAALACHGDLVASGGRDGTVMLWKRGDMEYAEIQGGGDAIRGLTFSCEGAALAGIDERGTFRTWNCEDGALRMLTPSHAKRFIAWCHTPSGDFGAMATDEHTAVLFSPSEAREVLRFDVPGQGITCLALHPGGAFLLAGCRDGYLHTWSIPEGKRLHFMKAHQGQVQLLAVNSSGTGAISAGWDGSVRLRALPGGELQTVMQGPGAAIRCLAATPCGEVLSCGSEGGILMVWETRSQELVHWHNLFCGRIECLALDPSGTLAACGDAQGRVSLWDIETGSLRATLEGHEGGVHALAVSLEGDLLASAGWDGVVRVWSLPEGTHVASLEGHGSAVTSLSFSPAGRFLVSGSHDRSAIVWDLESCEMNARISGHSHVVSCLGISGDGRILATGSWDRAIRLWSLPSGAPMGTPLIHAGRVRSLAVHPDGNLLVSAVDGGTISIWALPGGELIRNRVVRADARNGICIIPGMHWVASAGLDGSLNLSGLPWAKPMSRTTPADIGYVQTCISRASSHQDIRQWKFLERLLAGRFRQCIAYGGAGMPAGPHDIEIVEEPVRSEAVACGVRM